MAFKISWPGASTKIIQSFGADPIYWKDYSYIGTDGKTYTFEGNDGIAIEAEFRSEVKACAGGSVKAVDNVGDVRPYGNTITLEHRDGETIYQTIYCHLFKTHVTVGQQVQAGDVIGLADSSGSAIGSQLKVIVKKIGASAAGQTSYGTTDGRNIRYYNDSVDPADYLSPVPDTRLTKSSFNATFKDAVNVRSGPSTRFQPPLYTAPKGDGLQVVAISTDKEWYRLIHDGKEGWAHVTYVIFNGNVATLPVEKGPELKIVTPLQVPNHPLRGMHDGAPQWGAGAADWMVANGIRGWAVDMVYCGGAENLEKTYPNGFEGRHNMDYTTAQNAGVRVILRWNFSFAKSEGGGGTFGDPVNDERLIQFIGRSILNSKGVWGHIIGNEPNRAGENFDYQNHQNIGTPIRPERIAKIIKGVRKIVGAGHRLSPPALDGTNTESFQRYGQEIDIPNVFYSKLIDLLLPTDVDWIALHGYSRGAGDAPSNTAKFGGHPLQWQFFGFRMWEPFADILRKKGPDWERKPIVITETNHLKRGCRSGWNDANHNGWDDDAQDWIRSVYDYIYNWNQQPTEQHVHGLVLYRLSQDEWELEHKPSLIQAMRESGEKPV